MQNRGLVFQKIFIHKNFFLTDCFLVRDMIRHQLKRWEKVVNRPNGQLYQSCCNVCNPIYDAEPVMYKKALVVLARRHRFCQAYGQIYNYRSYCSYFIEELPYDATWYLTLVKFCSDLQATVEKTEVPEITRKVTKHKGDETF